MKEYDLVMILTEKCNLRCQHCYMEKSQNSLRKSDVDKILDHLPNNLARVSLEGGEVYCERDLLYYTIEKFRGKFGRNFNLRVLTNGVAFYDSPQTIIKEAGTLEELGADNIRVSLDEFHFVGGADERKLLSIGQILGEADHPLKVSYLSLDNAVAVGNAERLPEGKKQIRRCMNKSDCVDHPYLFTDINGNVYTCPWRITPPLGNLLEETLSNMYAEANELQQRILVGDISSIVGANEHFKTIQRVKGECMVCKEIFRRDG